MGKYILGIVFVIGLSSATIAVSGSPPVGVTFELKYAPTLDVDVSVLDVPVTPAAVAREVRFGIVSKPATVFTGNKQTYRFYAVKAVGAARKQLDERLRGKNPITKIKAKSFYGLHEPVGWRNA
jgi:hypothetical protein